MKILFVMDPGILIPVTGYGGIERIIEMLAKEYREMGHEVHLLVTKGSSVEGCTVHGIGKEGFPPNKWDARKAVPSVWGFLWRNRKRYDLVHNFGRLAYLLPILHHPVKKIMSYQREITPRNSAWMNRWGGKNLFFTGCSQDLVNRAGVKGEWQAIHNGCDFGRYRLQASPGDDAPLIFLGRIERIKGCHTAIRVAKATGHRLVIAGNVSSLPDERAYFENEIAPLVDGRQVQHIGTVNDAQKNEWLGKAKALLFPIEWEEPFGIVMVEAMACGTPVIGFNRGAVGEVIDEGLTGLKVKDEVEMVRAVNRLSLIDRKRCREHAMTRFHSTGIAKHYLQMVSDRRKRVVILSTHQPAANPRALKEYETLKEQGFAVKYLYAYNYDWSHEIDAQKFAESLLPRPDFVPVGGNPHQQPVRYFLSRVLYRLFRLASGWHPFFQQMAASRAAWELWQKAAGYKADLYIAHYLGALPAARRAAKRHRGRLLFDAEDFHRGERSYYPDQIRNVVAVEDRLLPKADAVTTASPLIREEYKKLFPGKQVVTINNVFSKRHLQPVKSRTDNTLKLFWFSQNIGPFRGLEVFVDALNELPGAAITLTIMGNRRSGAYERSLLDRAREPSRISFLPPVAPEAIFSFAAAYDIGLAGEVPDCYNKQVCLSNKVFSYLLAGNCILASDMPGQKDFLKQNPDLGFLYQHDSPPDLAKKIDTLYRDRSLLLNCKKASLRYGLKRFNWEIEKEKWLALVYTFTQGDLEKHRKQQQDIAALVQHRPSIV